MPAVEDLTKVLFETNEFKAYVDSGIKSMAPMLIGAGLGAFVPFVSPLIIAGLTSQLLPRAMKFAGEKIEIANEQLQEYKKDGGSKGALANVATPCLGLLKKVIPAPEKKLHEALGGDSTRIQEFLSIILNDDAKRNEFEDNLQRFLTGNYGSLEEFQSNIKQTMGITVDRLAIEAYSQFNTIFYNRQLLDKITTISQISEDDKEQIEERLEDIHRDFDRNFGRIEQQIERLYEDFRQSYGLVRLSHNYFKDYTERTLDLESWKKGFSFKLESIKENLEFRRTRVINSIEKKLDDQSGVLIVGPSGFSKTTIFYEIICDYYDKGYEILYNDGGEIRDPHGIQYYIEELLKHGNRVLVAVDDTHALNKSAIFFVMDRLLGLKSELRDNLKFILTARLPDLDRLIDERLGEIEDKAYRNSIRKLASKNEESVISLRFHLPPFDTTEIRAFFLFYYNMLANTKDEEIDRQLQTISYNTFKETNGHPILIKFLFLGHKLSEHVRDIYTNHLKNDAQKLNAMLACGLLNISNMQITSDLLDKMGILTYALDLENITLRQEVSEYQWLWKTLHPAWDVELLSFLYKDSKAGEDLKRKIEYLGDTLRSILEIRDEQISFSVIKSLYFIAADNNVSIDIIESVVSKHLPNYYLSEKTKCDLYALVMAATYGILGRYQKMLEMCETAISINEEFASAWYNKGSSLLNLERYEEAVECYNKAITIEPNAPDAWFDKGNALLHLERYEEAVECYNKAIELEPNYAFAWHNKGSALGSLDKYEEAIKCFDKVIEINPNDPGAWNNKGSHLYSQQKYEEAIKCFDKVIEINPNDPSAWNNKGVALGVLRRYKEANVCYDKLLEIAPNDASFWYEKGVNLDSLGNYEEAVECYNKALEIDPNLALAWTNRGADLFDLGRIEEAKSSYDNAIKLNPNDCIAWYNRASCMIKINDIQGCMADLTKAIECGGNSIIRLAKGNVLFVELRNDDRFKELIRNNDVK